MHRKLSRFLGHKATLPPTILFSHWMDCATACCGLPKTVRKAKPNPFVEDIQLQQRKGMFKSLGTL